jgi:DnaK suppressor protein
MANLKERQLESLTGLLRQQEATTRAALASATERNADERYADLAGAVPDQGDESTADVMVDTENAVVSRYVAELRDIEAAYERLHAGQYGICIDCGDEIRFLRLAAYPTAKRCAICQDRHEHTYAAAPHFSL